MSTPLPDGLGAIERALEQTVSAPAPGLRERVLAAALRESVKADASAGMVADASDSCAGLPAPLAGIPAGDAAPRAPVADRSATQRLRFSRRADPRWLAASAAAAVLFLVNLTRSASHAGLHGAPSRALCAALLDEPGADAAPNPFTAELRRACPAQAAAQAEESP